jgi:small subunit ribosomal protein S14
MAKESVKARQRKREAMVARYAEKRAALKAAGDYAALDLLPKKCITCKVEKPLPAYWPS